MLDPKLLPIQMNDLQAGASQYSGHPLNSELVGEQLRPVYLAAAKVGIGGGLDEGHDHN